MCLRANVAPFTAIQLLLHWPLNRFECQMTLSLPVSITTTPNAHYNMIGWSMCQTHLYIHLFPTSLRYHAQVVTNNACPPYPKNMRTAAQTTRGIG
jgi:hypothetical protein